MSSELKVLEFGRGYKADAVLGGEGVGHIVETGWFDWSGNIGTFGLVKAPKQQSGTFVLKWAESHDGGEIFIPIDGGLNLVTWPEGLTGNWVKTQMVPGKHYMVPEGLIHAPPFNTGVWKRARMLALCPIGLSMQQHTLQDAVKIQI